MSTSPTITVTISGPIKSGVSLVQAQIIAALQGLGLFVTFSGDTSVHEILKRTNNPQPYVDGMLAAGVRISIETTQLARAADAPADSYPVRPDDVEFPDLGIVVAPKLPSRDGWTVSEAIAGTRVSFPSKREALASVRFYRAYVRRWGYVNLAARPMYESDTPVMFTRDHAASDMLPKVYAVLRKRGVPGVPS